MGWRTRDEPTEEAVISLSSIAKRMAAGKGDYRQVINGRKCPFQDIEAPKSLCGRVINIVVWESEHWTLVHRENSSFGIGRFFRLKNARLDMDARCKSDHSLFCISMPRSATLATDFLSL